MTALCGVPASDGFAIGRALVYNDIEFPTIPRYAVEINDIQAHWQRLEEAVEACAAKVQTRLDALSPDKDKVQFDILTVHLLMLRDPDFLDQVRERLFSRKENIEWAVWNVIHAMAQKLAQSNNPYLRERALDIADMSNTLVRRLLSIEEVSLAGLDEEAIIVTRELAPSQALTMNREFVKGIVMSSGSYTSHAAILARSFGIPAIVGLSSAAETIQTGDVIAINGNTGDLVINPDARKRKSIRLMMRRALFERKALLALRDEKAVTKDGKQITLKANIQMPEETGAAFECGAEGIGLFRSEFLFLTPGEPMNEDRQTAVYTQVVKAAQGKSVTIRTSDTGGDKALPGRPAEERNPLLGWRAIRISLAMPEVFKTQLRAILRASAHGDVRIMFPMISGLEEMEKALAFVEECKAELRAQGVVFNEAVKTGSMVEIPSAALTAGLLAPKCDFFSIGTNDLMQYTLAVDRGNERVGYLADPRHPAFLRLIKMTSDAGQEADIPVSVCGEIGGDPGMIPLLIGLGIGELSMTAAQIPPVKQAIRLLRLSDCERRAQKALKGAPRLS